MQYKKMLDSITDRVVSSGALSPEQATVFAYGLDSALSSVMSYGALLCIGLLMGQWSAILLWLLSYTLLRQRAGGYHATTRLRCFLMSQLLGIAMLLLVRVLPLWSCWLLAVPSVAAVWWLAPIQHPNHLLNTKRRAKQHLLARIIVCVEFMLVVCAWWVYPSAAVPIALGMFAACLMMGIAAVLYRDAQALTPGA